MQIVGPVKAVNARTRKRKTEKATVLTGSSYKNFLESKVEKGRKQDKGGSGPEKKKKCDKKSKNHSGKTAKTRPTKKNATRKSKHKSVGNSNDNEPCGTCKQLFSEDICGRQWIQCQKCMKWYHNECQGINENYKEYNFTCIVCDDDDSE
jgi:hypothetical protein